MTEQYDIVIAGAGHNSLITAAYLGKAGYSCLLLEARPVIGGNTMTEELTLPGFQHDTCSTTHSIFMQSPQHCADASNGSRRIWESAQVFDANSA